MSKTMKHVVRVLRRRLPTPALVREMAEQLRVDESTIYNYRSGARKVGPEEIVAICRFLRISADELLGLEDVSINWSAVRRCLQTTERDVMMLSKTAAVVAKTLRAVQRVQPAAKGRPIAGATPAPSRPLRDRAPKTRRRSAATVR